MFEPALQDAGVSGELVQDDIDDVNGMPAEQPCAPMVDSKPVKTRASADAFRALSARLRGEVSIEPAVQAIAVVQPLQLDESQQELPQPGICTSDEQADAPNSAVTEASVDLQPVEAIVEQTDQPQIVETLPTEKQPTEATSVEAHQPDIDPISASIQVDEPTLDQIAHEVAARHALSGQQLETDTSADTTEALDNPPAPQGAAEGETLQDIVNSIFSEEQPDAFVSPEHEQAADIDDDFELNFATGNPAQAPALSNDTSSQVAEPVFDEEVAVEQLVVSDGVPAEDFPDPVEPATNDDNLIAPTVDTTVCFEETPDEERPAADNQIAELPQEQEHETAIEINDAEDGTADSAADHDDTPSHEDTAADVDFEAEAVPQDSEDTQAEMSPGEIAQTESAGTKVESALNVHELAESNDVLLEEYPDPVEPLIDSDDLIAPMVDAVVCSEETSDEDPPATDSQIAELPREQEQVTEFAQQHETAVEIGDADDDEAIAAENDVAVASTGHDDTPSRAEPVADLDIETEAVPQDTEDMQIEVSLAETEQSQLAGGETESAPELHELAEPKDQPELVDPPESCDAAESISSPVSEGHTQGDPVEAIENIEESCTAENFEEEDDLSGEEATSDNGEADHDETSILQAADQQDSAPENEFSEIMESLAEKFSGQTPLVDSSSESAVSQQESDPPATDIECEVEVEFDEAATDPGAGETARMLLDIMSKPSGAAQPQERALAADTLLRLVTKIPVVNLIGLSERICIMECPPPLLVNKLIRHPDARVAGPLLETCAAISDQVLLPVIIKADSEKRRMIARRRALSPALCDALLEHGDPSVFLTIVRNPGASLSHDAFITLSEQAKSQPSLQAPLVTRGDTPAPTAFELFWFLPSELRRYVLSRFLTDSETLDKILKIALSVDGGPESSGDTDVRFAESHQTEELCKLIEEGSSNRAAAMLSQLAGINQANALRIISDPDGDPLSVAMKALGTTRALFLQALKRWQASPSCLLRSERPVAELQNLFDTLSFNKARVLLTYWDWAALESGPYARKVA